MIDFHNFWTKNAILVLRYLMSFEQKYIENKLNYEVKIMTGIGSHSAGQTQTCLISDAILNEIESWNPSVKVTKLENDAVLSLDANDLKHFMQTHSNTSPWFK